MSGMSLNSLYRETGISRHRLADIFDGNAPGPTVGEIETICDALGGSPLIVVATAEWIITKQRPAMLRDSEAVDIAQWFELAAKDGWDFDMEAQAQQEAP